jgi:hypothetical protein
MNTKQIDYCIELAHTLNFSRAAENLFVSQPSFSYQIRLLEEEVGFDIFERSGKGALLILFLLARVKNKTASRSRRVRPRPRHVFFRASAASNTPSMCRRCIVS